MAAEIRCPIMPAGLSLEVSRHPPSMKRVVAMERLKGSRAEITLCSNISGRDFFHIMTGDFMEGRLRTSAGTDCLQRPFRTRLPLFHNG